VTRKN